MLRSSTESDLERSTAWRFDGDENVTETDRSDDRNCTTVERCPSRRDERLLRRRVRASQRMQNTGATDGDRDGSVSQGTHDAMTVGEPDGDEPEVADVAAQQ